MYLTFLDYIYNFDQLRTDIFLTLAQAAALEFRRYAKRHSVSIY